MMQPFEELKKIFEEFNRSISNIVSHYMDSTAGFGIYLKQIEQSQHHAPSLRSLPVSEQDKGLMIYAHGDPDDPNAYILHVCSFKDLKDRLRKGGRNEILSGQFCLVMLYEYWENSFRSKIAKTLKIKRDDIKADIFGDIRHIRNDIIHNNGYGTKEHSEKTKILTWYKEGNLINISDDQFETIIKKILEFRNDFMKENTDQEFYQDTILFPELTRQVKGSKVIREKEVG